MPVGRKPDHATSRGVSCSGPLQTLAPVIPDRAGHHFQKAIALVSPPVLLISDAGIISRRSKRAGFPARSPETAPSPALRETQSSPFRAGVRRPATSQGPPPSRKPSVQYPYRISIWIAPICLIAPLHQRRQELRGAFPLNRPAAVADGFIFQSDRVAGHQLGHPTEVSGLFGLPERLYPHYQPSRKTSCRQHPFCFSGSLSRGP